MCLRKSQSGIGIDIGTCMDEDWQGPVQDTVERMPTLASVERFSGRIWSVHTETVDFDGHQVERDVLLHLGAVAIIALDELDRVLLIRQYRHPVGLALFEAPAGLLDVDGEEPADTAARELAEEAGYYADSWHVLVDFLNRPGGSSEAIRVYLARHLNPIPGGRVPTGEAEESYLPRVWVDLDKAKDLVLSGAIGSPTAVCGILAAWAARAGDWRSLREPVASWPTRKVLLEQGRVHRR